MDKLHLAAAQQMSQRVMACPRWWIRGAFVMRGVCVCVCVYMCVCVCGCVCVCVCVCCMCVCVCIYTVHVHACVCMHASVCVCVTICVCKCICVFCMCVCVVFACTWKLMSGEKWGRPGKINDVRWMQGDMPAITGEERIVNSASPQ